MEEAKKMKCFKRLIYKKSQVFMAHSFWIICRNFSRIFVKLCMDTPYWCTVLVHQYDRRKSTKQLEFTFSLKVLSVHSRTSIRAHKHIFQYLKWYGYTAENQEKRLFSTRQQRDSIPILVLRTVKTRKFKLLYFRNETCYGNENLYKDLLFVYLQPSVNKNS